MDLFNCIMSRRSIRNFKDKPIDEDDLYLLVECGIKAPTAGNLQDFRFIVTQKPELVLKIANACMDQDWISRATGIIVICSQPKQQKELYGVRGEHIYSTQNAAAAAQNILLGANALGIGACWVGGFEQEEMDELLGADENGGRVEVIIALGYSNEKPKEKFEEELDVMMFFDKFGNRKKEPDKLKKDYSKIFEKTMVEAPEDARNFFEKSKYLVKQTIFNLNKNKKEKK